MRAAATPAADGDGSDRCRHQQSHTSDFDRDDVVEEMIDEQEQPLLGQAADELRSADARGAATSTSATSARILHALPQFSQWLHDAGSQAQQQMHGLRRQNSSSGSPLRESSLREHPSDAHITAMASEYHAAAVTTAHMPNEHYRVDTAPLSRHRGASASDTLPISSLQSPSLHEQHGHRSPRFDATVGTGGTATPLSLTTPLAPGASAEQNETSPRSVFVSDAAAALAADDLAEPLFVASAGLPPPTAHDASGGNADDQSALDELQVLFRRCHHSLPFVALFIVYFAYQHTTGIVVFFVGTVAIMGLDQRIRAQIALKDRASVPHLLGIVLMCAVDTLALCCIDGELNPLRHLVKTFEGGGSGSASGAVHDGVFWDVLWTVVVNDFIIRLWSVAVKAAVAVVKADKWYCLRQRPSETRSGSVAPVPPFADRGDDVGDLESGGGLASQDASPRRTASTVTFYRRKRKLYGIIEMVSIFARSLLAGVPWCSYYQLCSSKFIADTFTFGYIFIKAVILGSQGRRIAALVHSFLTLGLEFGVYVSPTDLVEAGSPDCSICYEDMQQPVKLACSHMFCEECVTEWFDRERSCPLCRASMATSPRGGSGSGSSDDAKPQYLDGSTSLFPQLF